MAKKPKIEGQGNLSEQGESFYPPQAARELLSSYEALLSDKTRAPLTGEEQSDMLLSGRRGDHYQPVDPKDALKTFIERSLRGAKGKEIERLPDEQAKDLLQQHRYQITTEKVAILEKNRSKEAARLVPFAEIRPEDGEEIDPEYVERFLIDLERDEGFASSWRLFRHILDDETYDEGQKEKINHFIEDAVSSRNEEHMGYLIRLADATFSRRYYWFKEQAESYGKASGEIQKEIALS